MFDSLKYLLEYPHENGFTTFVLGVLFVLSVYHFLLFFQHKNKVYLFYSLYTFLIFLNQTKFVLIDSDSVFLDAIKNILYDFHTPILWIYNTIYFVFGFTFLNLKKYSKKWYTFIFRVVYLLFSVILITVITFLITNNSNYIDTVNKVFIPMLFIFGIIAYYPLFIVKMPLSGYIIIGSFVLYVSSFLGQDYLKLDVFSENNATNSVFYIGVIIENIIFSLGLGQKQKMILQDKNDSQEKLIKQLIENEKLKNEIQKQLEEDVASISELAEKEKFEKLKAEYDRELIELKISSLRSQMNPHFIFNSLNAIKLYIIDNDKENAIYYLNKFSKLIRKILAITREKEITLAEEIETIKLYVDIENIRFQNEIETSFNIDKTLNLNTIKIPSLILQPFIENAIWHGLSSKKGSKKINLLFEKEQKNYLKITIEDNGIGREKSAEIKSRKIHKKESIGIKLTEERLKNYAKSFQNDYILIYEDLYDKNKIAIGTKIILKIPLQ